MNSGANSRDATISLISSTVFAPSIVAIISLLLHCVCLLMSSAVGRDICTFNTGFGDNSYILNASGGDNPFSSQSASGIIHSPRSCIFGRMISLFLCMLFDILSW